MKPRKVSEANCRTLFADLVAGPNLDSVAFLPYHHCYSLVSARRRLVGTVPTFRCRGASPHSMTFGLTVTLCTGLLMLDCCDIPIRVESLTSPCLFAATRWNITWRAG